MVLFRLEATGAPCVIDCARLNHFEVVVRNIIEWEVRVVEVVAIFERCPAVAVVTPLVVPRDLSADAGGGAADDSTRPEALLALHLPCNCDNIPDD